LIRVNTAVTRRAKWAFLALPQTAGGPVTGCLSVCLHACTAPLQSSALDTGAGQAGGAEQGPPRSERAVPSGEGAEGDAGGYL